MQIKLLVFVGSVHHDRIIAIVPSANLISPHHFHSSLAIIKELLIHAFSCVSSRLDTSKTEPSRRCLPLNSTKMYKWVPANLMLADNPRWTNIHPEGDGGDVEILQVAVCYGYRHITWVLRIIWLNTDFAFKLTIRLVVLDFQLLPYLCTHPRSFHTVRCEIGGVYMTLGRLSTRSEFTPVPSRGSIFVYMIPPQNVMPARVTPA